MVYIGVKLALQYIICISGILDITFFNIVILAKCISQYTEHPVFALGSILGNIVPWGVYGEILPSQEGEY